MNKRRANEKMSISELCSLHNEGCAIVESCVKELSRRVGTHISVVIESTGIERDPRKQHRHDMITFDAYSEAVEMALIKHIPNDAGLRADIANDLRRPFLREEKE
jgi:hypothetical protein